MECQRDVLRRRGNVNRGWGDCDSGYLRRLRVGSRCHSQSCRESSRLQVARAERDAIVGEIDQEAGSQSPNAAFAELRNREATLVNSVQSSAGNSLGKHNLDLRQRRTEKREADSCLVSAGYAGEIVRHASRDSDDGVRCRNVHRGRKAETDQSRWCGIRDLG